MRKFKWHILVLVRAIIVGKANPQLNSKQIEVNCQKIIEALSKHGETVIVPFKKAVEIIESMGDITDDRLKRQLVLEEMLAKIDAQ